MSKREEEGGRGYRREEEDLYGTKNAVTGRKREMGVDLHTSGGKTWARAEES